MIYCFSPDFPRRRFKLRFDDSCWNCLGILTLRGRASANPLADTTGISCAPFRFASGVFAVLSRFICRRRESSLPFCPARLLRVGLFGLVCRAEISHATRAAILSFPFPLSRQPRRDFFVRRNCAAPRSGDGFNFGGIALAIFGVLKLKMI